MEDKLSLGIYLHVPFCEKKCHYCDFLITVHSDQAHRLNFIQALKKQICFLAPLYTNRNIQTLYFGGGTPSLLSINEIETILSTLRSSFSFDQNVEITFEANPGDFDQEKLEGLLRLGINRLSLGVQSFDGQMLRELGRNHDLTATEKMLTILKKQGLANVSFDLLMAVPGQSFQQWGETLAKALAYSPQHFSIYDLEIQPKTYFDYLLSKNKIKPSSQDLSMRMYEETEKELMKAGYWQYELASFSLPGFECRHNLRYWNHQEYLGLGPGAYSYMDDERFQWASTIFRYYEKSELALWEKDFSEKITPKIKEKEILLTQIRLDHGLDLRKVKSIQRSIQPVLQKMSEEKLLDVKHEIVKLTSRGKQVYESIVEELLGSVNE